MTRSPTVAHERSIRLTAAQVRAVLAGTKTQHREVLKPQPFEWLAQVIDVTKPTFDEAQGGWGQWETIWEAPSHEMPMGQPEREEWRPLKGLRYRAGQRLWVKETLERANGEAVGYPADKTWLPNTPWCWTRDVLPSIHMPRWASRITLEVTEVRVQRLQDISEEDARAEGFQPNPDVIESGLKSTARGVFAEFWNRMHVPSLTSTTCFGANPWVTAITFRRIDQAGGQHG